MGERVSIARAPFNDKTADVILRSSNGVDFHVHKVVLSLASPLFKSMFARAQVSPGSKKAPVVNLPEDSTTLDHLLRYCFPVRNPVMSNVSVATRVLEAAKKYGLEEALESVEAVFRPFVSSSPLQVYATSCRLDWEDLAKQAAEALKATRESWTLSALFTERSTIQMFVLHMSALTAGCLYRLTRFLTHGDINRFCALSRPPRPGMHTTLAASVWPFNSPTADIVIRSSDGVDFRVHRLVIEYHTLAAEVPVEQSLFRPSSEEGTFAVDDKSEVLAPLLRLCYPSASAISEWTTEKYCDPLSIKVVQAAKNHGITTIFRDYAANFDKHVRCDPLGTYAVAVQLGWSEKALAAARQAVQVHTVDRLYSLLFENLPAIHLYQLWRFSHRFYAAVPAQIAGVLDGNSKRFTTHWRKPGNHGVNFEAVDRISILATMSRMPLSQSSSDTFGTLLDKVQNGVAAASSKLTLD